MQTPQETKMVKKPETTQRMVKIKTLKDIRLDPEERVITAGQVVEVTEEQAQEFCDKVITGHFNHSGERDIQSTERHKVKRAERV
jgi:hypothetical protein